jgi:hypothetical protein
MVAEAEVMHQAPVPVLEVQYHRCVTKGVDEVVGMSAAAVAVAAPAEVEVEVEVAVEVPRMVSYPSSGSFCSSFFAIKENHLPLEIVRLGTSSLFRRVAC